MTAEEQRRCYRCGEVKPLSEFNKDRTCKGGYGRICKPCNRLRGHEYYLHNQGAVCARTLKYNRAHPEATADGIRRYRAKHRERLLPDVKRRSAAWRATHRDTDRAAAKRWAAEHPAEYRAIQQRHRARKIGNEGSFTAAEWQAMKARYDYRCPRCGRNEPEISLTVDHVVPLALGGTNDISNIQPLCGPCNHAKGARESTRYAHHFSRMEE